MHPAIIRRMHMALYVLGTLPLTALLTALVLPGRMEVLWLFSAAALILLFFLPPEGKNKRGIWAILACVLTGCMGLALLPWQQNRLTLLVPFAVMLLLLIPPFRQRGEYMSYAFRAFGLIAFLVCFVASRLPSPEPFFTLAQTHLRTAFPFYLAVLLLIMNQEALDHDGLYGGVPGSVRRPNTLLTLVFAAAIVLISFWSSIQGFLDAAWNAVLRALFSLIPNEPAAPQDALPLPPAEGGGMLPVLDGPKEPNPFLQWLEKALLAVFPYIMLILVLVLAVYLCRRLFLFLRRWTRDRAQALEGAALADYVDQVEDVRDSRQTLRIRRVHRDRGGENDPRQRVRAAFRRLQKRHGEWTPSRTARACLNDADMASIYEKARYSSHDVTGEEAGKFAAYAEQKNSRGPT